MKDSPAKFSGSMSLNSFSISVSLEKLNKGRTPFCKAAPSLSTETFALGKPTPLSFNLVEEFQRARIVGEDAVVTIAHFAQPQIKF
jgi:hypothetical protein